MQLEPLLSRVDRLAGGRHSEYTVPSTDDARVRRAFVAVAWLLVGALVLGIASVVVAVVLTTRGEDVGVLVWGRCLVLLGITATLFYFAWRARGGRYWAFRRMQLFSRIFPVVALVLAAIPGLYPAWVVTEQIVFAILLIGVGDYLQADYMRAAYPKPRVEVTR